MSKDRTRHARRTPINTQADEQFRKALERLEMAASRAAAGLAEAAEMSTRVAAAFAPLTARIRIEMLRSGKFSP